MRNTAYIMRLAELTWTHLHMRCSCCLFQKIRTRFHAVSFFSSLWNRKLLPTRCSEFMMDFTYFGRAVDCSQIFKYVRTEMGNCFVANHRESRFMLPTFPQILEFTNNFPFMSSFSIHDAPLTYGRSDSTRKLYFSIKKGIFFVPQVNVIMKNPYCFYSFVTNGLLFRFSFTVLKNIRVPQQRSRILYITCAWRIEY